MAVNIGRQTISVQNVVRAYSYIWLKLQWNANNLYSVLWYIQVKRIIDLSSDVDWILRWGHCTQMNVNSHFTRRLNFDKENCEVKKTSIV